MHNNNQIKEVRIQILLHKKMKIMHNNKNNQIKEVRIQMHNNNNLIKEV